MAKFELSAFTDEYSPEIDKQIEGMLKNGIHYTELRGVDGKNVSEIDVAKAKEVKAKLEAGKESAFFFTRICRFIKRKGDD